MTDERREYLTNKLADMAISTDYNGDPFAKLSQDESRDILAMLNEGRDLPWKVCGPTLRRPLASFRNKDLATEWASGPRSGYTITGPDDAGEDERKIVIGKNESYGWYVCDRTRKPHKYLHTDGEWRHSACYPAGGGGTRYYKTRAAAQTALDGDRFARKLASGDTQPAQPLSNTEQLPHITFDPVELARPTLDQMPEGEPHRGHWPDSPITHFAGRIGKKVYPIAHDGSVNEDYGSIGDAENFTVLDADPIRPKTLADVADGVLIQDEQGQLVYRIGDTPIKFMGLPDPNYPPSDYTVVRPLGRPVFDG